MLIFRGVGVYYRLYVLSREFFPKWGTSIGMVGLTSRAYPWDNDSQFDEPAYFSNWAMIKKNTGYLGDEILPIYLWIIISQN